MIRPGIEPQFSWGCRIHWLLLCRGVRPIPNECPGYDTKQSDSEVPVMVELWGMRSIPSLPSLLGPLWPGVVAPERVLSKGQIELNCILMLNLIAWNRTVLTFNRVWIKITLNWIVWNRTFDSTEWLEIGIFLTIKMWTHVKLNCLK